MPFLLEDELFKNLKHNTSAIWRMNTVKLIYSTFDDW